jgi:hypothetical protein
MLPREWAEIVEPPNGCLIVERDELPTMHGILYLPAQLRLRTLSSTAKVLGVGAGVDPAYRVGQAVVLTASAGRPIYFGTLGADRTLVRITPAGVLLILREHQESVNEGHRPDALPLPQDPYPEQIDAGDPRALR